MIFNLIALVLIAYMIIMFGANMRKGMRVLIILALLAQPYMHLSVGSISVQALLVYVVSVSLFFNYTLNRNNVRSEFKNYPHNNAFWWLMIPMFICIFFNSVSDNIYEFSVLLTRKVMYLYLGWMAFDNIKDGQRLMRNILIVFVCLCMYGFYELSLNNNPILDYFRDIINDAKILSYSPDGRGYRVQTIFYHPYPWGGVLIIFSSVLLFLILNGRRAKYFTVYVLVFVMFVANICLTRSRSAILPEFLLIGLLFAVNSGNFSRRVKIVIAIMGTAFLVFFINPDLFDKVAPYFSTENQDQGSTLHGSSADMRLLQFAATFVLIKDDPIIGKGFNYSTLVMNDVGGNTDLQSFESIWLITMLNNGLLGMFAYFMFFFILFKNFIKFKRYKQLKRPTNFVIITLICYVAFISLTGEMNTFTTFFIYIGVCTKYLYIIRKKLQAEDEARRLENEKDYSPYASLMPEPAIA
jgi:hypothetical protein